MELQTSEYWQRKHIKSGDLTAILDPDGWNRSNFQYSFYEEKISEEEYYKRRDHSTTFLQGRKND